MHVYTTGMYVRTIPRKNRDGSTVTYLQLAHNVWNKEKGHATKEIIYSFGRLDELDLHTIRRLVKGLSRFLSPEEALQASFETGTQGSGFIKSLPMGGVYLLCQLWEALVLHDGIVRLLEGGVNLAATRQISVLILSH